MLIDYTYFFGNLTIGQLSQAPVQDKVNWFINQYEPHYLRGVLGYAAYKQLMADVLLPSIPQRWEDLIWGVEYTKDSVLQRWDGLIRVPAGNPVVIDGSNQIDIVVGRGRDIYDPTPSAPGVPSTTTIIPPSLVGNGFTFVQRSYGPLRPDEFSVSGNVLTLLGGLVFSNQDTYFYYGNSTLLQNAGTTVFYKESPIANYIYYWYQRAQLTSTGGTGEVKTDNENSRAASPKYKMALAWNTMKDMNIAMYDFLLTNQETYPEWYNWASVDDSNIQFIKPINVFGI